MNKMESNKAIFNKIKECVAKQLKNNEDATKVTHNIMETIGKETYGSRDEKERRIDELVRQSREIHVEILERTKKSKGKLDPERNGDEDTDDDPPNKTQQQQQQQQQQKKDKKKKKKKSKVKEHKNKMTANQQKVKVTHSSLVATKPNIIMREMKKEQTKMNNKSVNINDRKEKLDKKASKLVDNYVAQEETNKSMMKAIGQFLEISNTTLEKIDREMVSKYSAQFDEICKNGMENMKKYKKYISSVKNQKDLLIPQLQSYIEASEKAKIIKEQYDKIRPDGQEPKMKAINKFKELYENNDNKPMDDDDLL